MLTEAAHVVNTEIWTVNVNNWIVLFYILFLSIVLFYKMYCLFVNVYCTTATGCLPNCSLIYHIYLIISHITSYLIWSYLIIIYIKSHHITYHNIYHNNFGR